MISLSLSCIDRGVSVVLLWAESGVPGEEPFCVTWGPLTISRVDALGSNPGQRWEPSEFNYS